MQSRSAELTAFLTSLNTAILERACTDRDSHRITEIVMQALEVQRPSASQEPARLPVCEYLDDAMENVAIYASQKVQGQSYSTSAKSLVEHVQALGALEKQLVWWHRTSDVEPGSPFSYSHANATIVGKGGLEEREDVTVGITLMAPGIEYPEHHHPPEEVYLVLSPGYWQQAGGEWFEPGIGGLVHNTPDIMHAFRSELAPLLTTWCLWSGD